MQSKVYKTTDLRKFKTVHENRPIDQRHVKRLENLIQRNGWLDSVIVVNKDMGVLDGQHRIEALRDIQSKTGEEFTVQYIMTDNPDLSPEAINIAQKNWNTADYVHLIAERGNVSYKYIDQLFKQFSPPFAKSTILKTIRESDSIIGTSTTSIKEGKLVITAEQYNEAREFLTWSAAVLATIKENGNARQILLLLRKTFSDPEIDNAQMAAQINAHPDMIKRTSELAETEVMINKIYNYRKSKNTCDLVGRYSSKEKWGAK